MANRRIELNPGEYMLVADRAILVDEYESIIANTRKIGSSESHAAYLFTFKGRINNSDEQDSVTVVLTLESAWELIGTVLDGLELFKKTNEEASEK